MYAVILIMTLLCYFLSPVHAQEPQASVTSLSLQDALDRALSQHPTLRIGQTEVEAAQQRVRQEKTGYLPRGGYTYTYSRQQIPVTTAVGGIEVEDQTRTTAQTFNFHSTAFSLDQLLFDFGRTLDTIRAAAAEVEARHYDVATTRQTLIFTTKQAYYSLLAAQRFLRLAEETVQDNQHHLAEAQARFDTGLAARFDVTQSQVQLSNAELTLISARNNVALARETLRTAMGETADFAFRLTDSLDSTSVTLSTFTEDVVLKHAYANRPELRSLQAQHRAAAQRLSALQKHYLPSVSGTAQYNWTGRDYPLADGWLWGVTLTFPLFDDVRTLAQVGEAKARLRTLDAQAEHLRQQIGRAVRQASLRVREATQRVQLSQRTFQQARDNLELAAGRYTTGLGNIIELTGTQVLLTSAQANQIQALAAFNIAVAELERAVGQRLE